MPVAADGRSCRIGTVLSTCAEEVSLKLKNVQLFFTSNVDLMILGCSPLAPYRIPYVAVYKCHSTDILINTSYL